MALTELQPFNLNDTANYTFGNATITGNVNVGNAVLYTSGNTLVIQNPAGGTFTVSGTGSAGTSQIANGDSNISILNNANINFSVAGYSNRVVFSETTANFAANLTVNGLITGGNANLGNSVTANFFVGNLYGNANAAGVANTANFVYGNAVSGEVAVANTVSNSSQPNITSLGTLVDLAVAGNVTATTLGGALTSSSHPNVTQLGTLVNLSVTGNILTSSHLVSDNITGNANTITISAAGSNQNVNLRPTGTGTVDVGNFRISNISAPVASTDAATKEYVDSTAQGLNVHPSCYVATTGTLASLSGGTTSYNNGSSGVGATITTTGTFLNIDGANVQTVGTRILVKNEANAAWNGIYTYTNTTTLTRATDFDTSAEANGGDFTFVTSGNTFADSGWVQTTDSPTIGTSNIVWSQFSGAGTYTAGDGLTLNGTQFSVNTSLPNLTSVGTLTSLSVTGNISGGNINTTGTANLGTLIITGTSNLNAIGNVKVTGGGNGQVIQTDGNGNLSFVTIDTWKIQNGVSNVSVPSVNGNVIVGVATNTIATFSTAGLTINGNITSNGGVITGDGGGLSNIVGGNITGSVANATYAATSGGADTANTVSVNAQPNITSVGTLSNVTVSGNANVGALLTNSILYANGAAYEFTTNAGGQNTYVQFNDSNIFGGSANFTFNKTTNTLTVTRIAGNGAALTSLTGANVTGIVPTAAYSANAGNAINVTGNSQPNITTLGILSNLTITGNTTSGNFVTNGTMSTNTLAVSGNGTITGNLTVSGTTTFVNTATLSVEYPIISVGRGTNNAPLTTNDGKDRGEQLWYFTTSEKQAFIGYDNSTGNLIAATDVSIFNEVVSVNSWGNFVAGGIVAQGNLQVAGDTTINGNFTVLGNTTFTNSNSLNVVNPIISMGRGPNDAPLVNNDGLDRGSQMWYYTTGEKSAFMGYDNSSGKLIAATDVSVANYIVTVNGYGTLVAGNLEVGGIVASGDISGANIAGGNLLSANYISGTIITAAQPNITSVGTLTGANVNGNITAANITANTGKFTGNGSGLSQLTGANVTGQVTYAATANSVAVGNVSGIGNIATVNKDGNASNILYGNGVFASAPVTYGNSNVATFLASYGSNTISTTGNITAGNANLGNAATANYFVGNLYGTANTAGTVTTAAQPNITSVGTLSSVGVTGNVSAGNLTTTGILSVTGTSTSSIAGNVNMNSKNITNLADPVNAQDAATKNYVDTTAQGLHVHDSCNAATTTTLAVASGGTVTYNNGTSGVGATLTTTGSYTTIDGVTISTVGSRILVKNEANATWNGVYVYSSSTVLTRATDFDTAAEMAGGDFLFVTTGTTLADTGWVQTTDNPIPGVSNIVFNQFSGAGTYQAGTGLTLTGQTFSVNASQTQVTAVGTLTSLGVSGNITAANITANTGIFAGNGAGLTNLAGANVTGTVANATYATSAGTATSATSATTATSATSATTAGTVTTAAQPNITSVGTLTSLAVTGNISGANLTGTHYGAATGLTSIPGANVTGTVANATYATSAGSATSATTAGTVTTAAQPNITSVGTLSGLSVTATITGSVSGSAGTAGTVTTAAQPNITSTGTLTSVSVSGVSTLPKINVNRSSSNTTGITWYSSTYSSWTDYMASAGNTSCGPYGNITAPTGNLVTAWGLRSFIENTAGYGWTWEVGTAQQTTPSIVAELRSSDGSFRNTGNIYCVGDVITNYSDEKLKDVVGKIENAVDKVCAIDTFYYRPNEIAKSLGVADELQVGVGAGSVEKVASEVVKPSPLHPDYKTVMYERLVPYLIESIKEHEKTIRELKQEINKLKGE